MKSSLVAVLIVGALLAVGGACLSASAQQNPPHGSAPIDKFWIVSQDWRRFPGLAVADITFVNGNPYHVRDAVISCDFFAPNGKLLASRGSTVFQSFPPGERTVKGVEFTLRETDAVPGTCRVISVSTVSQTQ